MNSTISSRHLGHDLVPCAISRQAQTARISVFADILVVKIPRTDAPRRKPPKRGSVVRFTPRSRKRMLVKMATLRNPEHGWMVTLTYPGLFTWSSDEVKQHIDNLRHALSRAFPSSGAIWRMELKERLSGASQGQTVPHFHLLLFGVDERAADLRAWFDKVWSRLACDPAEYEQAARTDVRKIKSRRHAMNYAAKYAAKVDSEVSSLNENQDLDNENSGEDEKFLSLVIPTWGRFWGYFGSLDFDVQIEVETTVEVAIELRRFAAKLLKSRRVGYAKRLHHTPSNAGYSVFGLGDLSNDLWGDIYHSTIWQMLAHAGQLVDDRQE